MLHSGLDYMTSNERYVGQSTISFIRDVAYAGHHMNDCRSPVYEPRWSKIGTSKASRLRV